MAVYRASRPVDVMALRERPRQAHQAGFFYRDTEFGRAAVKILPGEYFVSEDDVVLTTTLGSCIAACLYDPGAGVGGMNHFMLPERPGSEGDSGRFGAFAMELLINGLLHRGAQRERLQAKVFGGGQVMKSLAATQIGSRNVAFVAGFLERERIPVVAQDVLDVYPRRICMFPAAGRVLCKRLAPSGVPEMERQESGYRRRMACAPASGEIELFQEQA